jgi:hypothetical protein
MASYAARKIEDCERRLRLQLLDDLADFTLCLAGLGVNITSPMMGSKKLRHQFLATVAATFSRWCRVTTSSLLSVADSRRIPIILGSHLWRCKMCFSSPNDQGPDPVGEMPNIKKFERPDN